MNNFVINATSSYSSPPKKNIKRFNSLQQQYKILSTKHEDLEQQCRESKKSLATENDELKGKLDHVKAQLSKTLTSKDNDDALWKVDIFIPSDCTLKNDSFR